LTLTGEGQVQAKPDMVMISLGVVTNVPSAQEATAKNTEQMNRVIVRLRGLGITGEDLQTTGFNIAPIIDYDANSPTHDKIISYRVEELLTVRAPVALAGRILDEATGAGANMATNLSFAIRDETLYRQRALQAAVRAAQQDAETLAKAMGVALRGTANLEVLYGGGAVLLRTALAAGGSATQIEPGRLTVSCGVRMVFKYDSPSEMPRH
jgi:uncharacterized protein YggE